MRVEGNPRTLRVKRIDPDVIILDVNLPDGSGLSLLPRFRELDARVPVIVITGHGTTETAIEAMKLGAFEYVLKPLDLATIRQLIQHAAEIGRHIRRRAVLGASEPDMFANVSCDSILGNSSVMQDVYKTIGRVAATDMTVLIQGESGTGKELVARAIYQHSARKNAPFRSMNCAALPESLVESELFGHERGAFTDADRQRIGKFEQCSGGTLFLDEIGDMSPLTQAKILRVLQEQTLERVGGNETIHVDVRVLAATHHELTELVAKKQFRTDLYYRLGAVTINLPPLRHRLDDLPLLAEYYVRRYSSELMREVVSIVPAAIDQLMKYDWPGNIRELQSILKLALLKSSGPELLPEFLPPLGMQNAMRHQQKFGLQFNLDEFVDEQLALGTTELHQTCLQELEQILFATVLKKTHGNISQAARTLGMNRRTLRLKLHAYGLAPPNEE